MADNELALGDAQKLITRFIGQLIDGCASNECRQSMCHTGRLNSAGAPVRMYKTRSAKAIALTLCSGPEPRQYLCHFYHCKSRSRATITAHESRDESSLVQQLCDTTIAGRLDGSQDCTIAVDPEREQLRIFHDQISALLRGSTHQPGKDFRTNPQLIKILIPALDWLLARALSDFRAWQWADREVVGEGKAYPPKSSIPQPDWLANLDVLNHDAYLRLLEQICHVVARRVSLERAISNATSRPIDNSRSLGVMLVDRLFRDKPARSEKIFPLLVWLKRLFAKCWDAQTIIQVGSASHGILTMMKGVHCIARTAILPEDYHMPMVSACITTVDLAESWLKPEIEGYEHILQWSFMMTTNHLYLFFRSANHLLMRRAHSEVHQARLLNERAPTWIDFRDSEQTKHDLQYYLLLSVSRGDVLKDTFDQLWQRRKSELRRPLRVRLGEVDELEIGHDLGGVQIEFFNLVCRELFSESAQLFVTDQSTGCSYFRPGSLQPLYMFEMFGLLMAVAMYNGVTLPINMPLVFYRLLASNDGRSHDTILPEKIADGWPTMSRSLRSILNEDVDDLELEYSFPLEANGLRMTACLPSGPLGDAELVLPIISATLIAHHAEPHVAVERRPSVDMTDVDTSNLTLDWPGWHVERVERVPDTVKSANKAKYVQDHIEWLVNSSVFPQLMAFQKGFHEAGLFKRSTLQLFGEERLKLYVEGTDTLDINELRAATRYDGYDGKSKYIASFWRIVTSWAQEKQKQLLKFVTAAERIPITGASHFTFVIKKSHPDSLDNLPTSSTCFGTLMLPRYGSTDILEEKLSKAIEYGAVGFGNG